MARPAGERLRWSRGFPPIWGRQRFRPAFIAWSLVAALVAMTAPPASAQEEDRIRPVTDAELANPSPDEWLMWRRTLDGWGYSPLDQIDRGNVGDLRLVWSRALTPGRQQGTPLVRDGVLFMPNPRDTIQALDAVTGDLIWEHRRDRPDDLADYMIGTLIDTNRNIAIHDELIRETGEFLWATPTVVQNVVRGIDGAVTENAELIFTAAGQTVLACPHASGGKDWEAGAYSPRNNTMYMPLRNVCSRMMAMAAPDEQDEARRLYWPKSAAFEDAGAGRAAARVLAHGGHYASVLIAATSEGNPWAT